MAKHLKDQLCPACGQPRYNKEAKAELAARLPERGYVRMKLLIQLVPFSEATLWRRVADGRFPKPVKLSARVTAWRVEDVKRWLAEQGVSGVASSLSGDRNS